MVLSIVPALLYCTWLLGDNAWSISNLPAALSLLCRGEGRCSEGQAEGLSLTEGVAGELYTCHLCPRFSQELTKQLFVSADGKIMR